MHFIVHRRRRHYHHTTFTQPLSHLVSLRFHHMAAGCCVMHRLIFFFFFVFAPFLFACMLQSPLHTATAFRMDIEPLISKCITHYTSSSTATLRIHLQAYPPSTTPPHSTTTTINLPTTPLPSSSSSTHPSVHLMVLNGATWMLETQRDFDSSYTVTVGGRDCNTTAGFILCLIAATPTRVSIDFIEVSTAVGVHRLHEDVSRLLLNLDAMRHSDAQLLALNNKVTASLATNAALTCAVLTAVAVLHSNGLVRYVAAARTSRTAQWSWISAFGRATKAS